MLAFFEVSGYNNCCVTRSGTNYIKDALLAQLVEHLTLNQGVRGSSPRRRTVRMATLSNDFTEVAFCFALIYKALLQSKAFAGTSFTNLLIPWK